jgi:hypothetical protein
MARTLKQVYDALTADKETKPELDELLPNPDNYETLFTQENFTLLANTVVKGLSDSLVAVWRLFLWSTAVGIWSLENLQDIFKSEVTETILANQYGQLRWYQTISQSFQLGDQLVWNGNYYEYETIDTTKQIITQAAATVSDDGVITLKVAKGDLPNIEPLTTSELESYVYYIKGSNSPAANDAMAPAGTLIEILSAENDDLKFAIDIFYDPLVLASDGSQVAAPTVFPVEDAINDFINTLPFDSTFRVIGLVDAIQAVEGVNNLVVLNCDARKAGEVTYTDVLAETGQKYTTFSGYLRMDPLHPLDGNYNGIPTLNFEIES